MRSVAGAAVDDEDAPARCECRSHRVPERVEALLRYMREPEGEEDEVEALLRLPGEEVGDHVLDLPLDARAVDLERLRRGIDRDEPVGVTDEVPCPEPGSRRQLDNAAARPERLESRLGLGDIRLPARERLRIERVASAPEPPVVVLRRALRVVPLLLREDVAHAATASSTNRSTPSSESAYRSARGSGLRTSTAGSPTAWAPSTSARMLSPTIHASVGRCGSSTDANARSCGFSYPVSAEQETNPTCSSRPSEETIRRSSGTWFERIACFQPACESRSSAGSVSSNSAQPTVGST